MLPTYPLKLAGAFGAHAPQGVRHAAVIPAEPDRPEHWSAFVAPDLAPIFNDTPWLDLPPNLEGQAELLARLVSISPDEWEVAQAQLGVTMVAQPTTPTAASPQRSAPATPATTERAPAVSQSDPRRFLLRRRDQHAAKAEFLLAEGDLLVMAGSTQAHYQHALPKSSRVHGERINLTFRTAG